MVDSSGVPSFDGASRTRDDFFTRLYHNDGWNQNFGLNLSAALDAWQLQ